MTDHINGTKSRCTMFKHTTEGELSYTYADTNTRPDFSNLSAHSMYEQYEKYTASSIPQEEKPEMVFGVNILGTLYNVFVRPPEADKLLEKWDGYCDWTTRTIVLSNCADKEGMGSVINYCKHIATHEVIHAALHESGMDDYNDDERLVEWMACMIDKIKEISDDISYQVRPYLSVKGERGCE